jgi:hypothetical protein
VVADPVRPEGFRFDQALQLLAGFDGAAVVDRRRVGGLRYRRAEDGADEGVGVDHLPLAAHVPVGGLAHGLPVVAAAALRIDELPVVPGEEAELAQVVAAVGFPAPGAGADIEADQQRRDDRERAPHRDQFHW